MGIRSNSRIILRRNKTVGTIPISTNIGNIIASSVEFRIDDFTKVDFGEKFEQVSASEPVGKSYSLPPEELATLLQNVKILRNYLIKTTHRTNPKTKVVQQDAQVKFPGARDEYVHTIGFHRPDRFSIRLMTPKFSQLGIVVDENAGLLDLYWDADDQDLVKLNERDMAEMTNFVRSIINRPRKIVRRNG